jgi:hypothetical protein
MKLSTPPKRARIRANWFDARARWGRLPSAALRSLRTLTEAFGIRVAAGDVILLDGSWYVTHSGLLRLAHRRRCAGIRVQQVREFCDPALNRWVFKATVYTSPHTKGFVGYGDADPSNVSSLVHGAEMRVAETRAVNRALRKAYGIGLCSVEELGWSPKLESNGNGSKAASGNGHQNGQPRLRDRLCLLIRQYGLDANLVKAYAADYCGTPVLSRATRPQIEAFINHLAERAANDREGLLCHLQSFSNPQEVAK